MDVNTNLADELERAFAANDISRRAELLRRVTDLFVLGSGSFSADQVALFDNVMGRLIGDIEHAARVQFGARIAGFPDAPPHVIRDLAFDASIEVAGPVLRHSERLDQAALLQTARTQSQDHLLAISGRKRLDEAVTDVLVERGNQAVVASTAKNGGARFSEFGISVLVEKARDDGELALSVWVRPDIPRQAVVKLFVAATGAVQGQLVAADPRRAEAIRAAVATAADQIQTQARIGSHEFIEARSLVRSLHASGMLDEAHLLGFARDASFDKTATALALMCDLPIGLVERALAQSRTEQVLVLAKALDLSWDTAKALLMVQAGTAGRSREELDQCLAVFARLQPKTARTAIQFYRMREKANLP